MKEAYNPLDDEESLNENMYNDKDSLFKDSQEQRYPNVKNSYDYMEIARKALEKVVRLCNHQNPSGKKLGMAIENVLNIWQDYHNASDARGEMDYYGISYQNTPNY